MTDDFKSEPNPSVDFEANGSMCVSGQIGSTGLGHQRARPGAAIFP